MMFISEYDEQLGDELDTTLVHLEPVDEYIEYIEWIGPDSFTYYLAVVLTNTTWKLHMNARVRRASFARRTRPAWLGFFKWYD
jgi:hypothetical protein